MEIREYSEEMRVEILFSEEHKRWIVKALNEGGYNWTQVDLIDLIEWIKINKPELL